VFNDIPHPFLGSTTFHVDGMTCDQCRRAVIREISQLAHVRRVTIDPATGTVTVSAAQTVDRVDVARAVVRAGYVLRPSGGGHV
jgi:copper chaperone CopZ